MLESKQNQALHRKPVGIDLMGAETPPEVLHEAALKYKAIEPESSFILFATDCVAKSLKSPFPIITSPDFVTMDDSPTLAVRRKKKSSLLTALRALKNREISSLLSCANTGALTLAAKTILGMKTPYKKPALIALIPTKQKPTLLLDVGATLFLKATDLISLAFMGIEYQNQLGIKKPRIALLNIGKEPIKGTPELKEAYQTLTEKSAQEGASFTFTGNIEGRDLFTGGIDIVITHGFTGNIFLKAAEGVAALFHAELPGSGQILPQDHPGAILGGVNGLVMKCHGNTSQNSFFLSIQKCHELS